MDFAHFKNALCLSHAAREWLPPARSGRPAHPSVLARWSDRGILVNGERVYLRTWRCGGQRITTKPAVEEFLTALNAGRPLATTQEQTA